MKNKKNKRGTGLYKRNKETKVGEVIECPVCHEKFIKRQYSQAFCCGHCKDTFWNRKGDRHNYEDYSYDDMDHEWDEAFGVAEYSDEKY